MGHIRPFGTTAGIAKESEMSMGDEQEEEQEENDEMTGASDQTMVTSWWVRVRLSRAGRALSRCSMLSLILSARHLAQLTGSVPPTTQCHFNEYCINS